MIHQFITPYMEEPSHLYWGPIKPGVFPSCLHPEIRFVDRDMFGQVIGYGKAPACEYCATCYRGNENRCDSCGAPRKPPKPNKDWITTCPTS